jgi:hypothetical protein
MLLTVLHSSKQLHLEHQSQYQVVLTGFMRFWLEQVVEVKMAVKELVLYLVVVVALVV